MTQPEPRLHRWTAAALAGALAAGVLTLWMPGAWPAALFQAAVLGLALLFTVTNAAAGGRWHWPAWLLPLGLILAWAAAQVAAGWTEDGWATSGKVMEWGAVWAAVFLLAQTAEAPRVRGRLVTALLVFSSLLAAQALLQTFTSGGRVFWLFDSGYEDNVLGPFVYHNKYAQFVELVLPVALWRGLTRRREGPLWLVAAAVMFAGVVAGASRAGFLILLAELPVVILLAWRRQAISGRMAALVGAQAAVVTAAWGFIAGWGTLWARLAGIDPLADLRWPLMRSTWEMALAHPWTGVGLGAWPLVYPEYARFDSGVIANQAHSDWLQWAAEGGVPMLVLVAAWVAMTAPALVRSGWGIGFLAVCVHALVDYPFQQLPAFTALVFAVGALAAIEGARVRTVR